MFASKGGHSAALAFLIANDADINAETRVNYANLRLVIIIS
jgi:hypothetical protein